VYIHQQKACIQIYQTDDCKLMQNTHISGSFADVVALRCTHTKVIYSL